MMSLVFPVASIAHTSPTIVFFLCSLVAGNEKKTRKNKILKPDENYIINIYIQRFFLSFSLFLLKAAFNELWTVSAYGRLSAIYRHFHGWNQSSFTKFVSNVQQRKKKRVVSVCDYIPPRLFRSSSSAGWKAKRQGSRPWTIPVGCDLPPTCCLVSFKQSFHLRFLYDLSSVENKAIFTLNYIISHFGRKQQERRLVVTLRTDELKVSSHRKP